MRSREERGLRMGQNLSLTTMLFRKISTCKRTVTFSHKERACLTKRSKSAVIFIGALILELLGVKTQRLIPTTGAFAASIHTPVTSQWWLTGVSHVVTDQGYPSPTLSETKSITGNVTQSSLPRMYNGAGLDTDYLRCCGTGADLVPKHLTAELDELM